MATATTTRRQTEQLAGTTDEWIDAVKASLDAQTEFFVGNLRSWNRLMAGMVEMYANAADAATGATLRSTQRAASTAREAATQAAGRATQAAEATAQAAGAARQATESMSDSLVSETRRAQRQTQDTRRRGAALEALTVDQLDRLAATVDVDEYPHSGTKTEKVEALSVARLSLDALTIEHLDRLAEANELEEYPHSGTKADKIAALEAARVGVS